MLSPRLDLYVVYPSLARDLVDVFKPICSFFLRLDISGNLMLLDLALSGSFQDVVPAVVLIPQFPVCLVNLEWKLCVTFWFDLCS